MVIPLSFFHADKTARFCHPNHTGLCVFMAVNSGGRDELKEAVKQIFALYSVSVFSEEARRGALADVSYIFGSHITYPKSE